MSSLPYPQCVIWYIRASRGQLGASEGSAVAVQIQQQGNPASTKTCLLTCGHVIRGSTQNGKAGYGPILPDIYGWMPGRGLDDRAGAGLKISLDTRQVQLGEIPSNEWNNAADDWVLLDFKEPRLAQNVEGIRGLVNNDQLDACTIVGYPGGKAAFYDSVVTPTTLPVTMKLRDEHLGMLKFTEDRSKGGFSGGGIFETSQWRLLGIHRGKTEPIYEQEGISIQSICRRMKLFGWTILEDQDAKVSSDSEAPPPNNQAIPATPERKSGGWSLDDVPINWSRPEAQELLSILFSNFDEAIAMIIAENTGIAVHSIRTGGPRDQLWRDLLKVAARQGKLRDLILSTIAMPEYAAVAKQLKRFL